VPADTRVSLRILQKKNSFDRGPWRDSLSQLLTASERVVTHLDPSSGPVIGLITCVNGMEFSAALSSMVQLMLDPFYRTLWGFQVLIEKEWCHMGYPWVSRLGHVTDHFFGTETCSALIVLWLDAVFQLLRVNPTAFEFTEDLLCTIGRHLYSCRFGNFLGATEEERSTLGLANNTMSLWSFINTQRSEFLRQKRPSEAAVASVMKLTVPESSDLEFWARFHRDINHLSQVGTLKKLSHDDGACACFG